jgi:hypothetical protein
MKHQPYTPTYPTRRILWADGKETMVPEIPAYREADNRHLTFYCPECLVWHRHGAGTFIGDGDGHRSAHCHSPRQVLPDGKLRSKPESAFARTGYYLREVGLFTRAVIAQFPKELLGKPFAPRAKQLWPESATWPLPAPAPVLKARERILAAFDAAFAEEEDLTPTPDGECTLALPSADLYTAAQEAGSSEEDVTRALKLLGRSNILSPEWHEGRFCYAMPCVILSRACDLTERVDKLLSLVDADDPVSAGQKAECREIGQLLYDLGGSEAMRAAGEHVRACSSQAGRLLERIWDGVGDWKW